MKKESFTLEFTRDEITILLMALVTRKEYLLFRYLDFYKRKSPDEVKEVRSYIDNVEDLIKTLNALLC